MKKTEYHVHDGEHSTLNKEQLQPNQELKERESKNSEIEIHFLHPHIQVHWNKVPKKRYFKRSNGLSFSSKMRVLHSCQTKHIKHSGTIFHMVERCFPNQFVQAKKRELTDFGITYWIPNTSKASHHKAWENLQWSRRWSIDSPLQQHNLSSMSSPFK